MLGVKMTKFDLRDWLKKFEKVSDFAEFTYKLDFTIFRS